MKSKRIRQLLIFAPLLFWSNLLNAQSVGIGIEEPNPNAVLELVSPESNQGLLIPKMTTTQRTSSSFTSNLTSEENGLLVFDSEENAFYYWQDGSWQSIKSAFSLSAGAGITITGSEIANTGDLDITNEIQDISLTGTDLSISSGSTIDLSTIDTNTQLSDADIATFGYIKSASDGDTDSSNEIQDISLVGTSLSISDGSTVDLAGVDTDTQLSDADILALGYIKNANDADADVTNEIQDISLLGSNLSISSGSTIDLSSIDTDTNLSDSDISALGYIKSADDADADATNELQDLGLTGNTLSLTNSGSTVDLTAFMGVNTDNQTLGILGSDLSISGGNTIDLSAINTNTQLSESEVDAFVSNNGYLTVEVDGSTSNEIQDISLAGSDLSITFGSTIDLSDIDTNTQLSEGEVDAFVSNNGYLIAEVDGSTSNEIQDISLAGNDLTITSGSTIDLSGIDTNTQLSDGDIMALGYIKDPNDADADPTNELLTTASMSGNTLQLFEDTNNVDVDLSQFEELPAQGGQSGNFLTTDGTSASWSSISTTPWITNLNDLSYSAGNVSIGTPTATSLLTLQKTDANSSSPMMTITESGGTSDASMTMVTQGGGTFSIGIDASDGHKFKISDHATLGTNDRFTILSSGNIGIGNPTPAHQLDITGDLLATEANTQATPTNATAGIIRGSNTSTTGGVGIVGATNQNNSTGTGNRYGIVGLSWYSQSSNYGLYGYAFGGTTSYGIYARAISGSVNNYAGYFAEGDVLIENDLALEGDFITPPTTAVVSLTTTSYTLPLPSNTRIVRIENNLNSGSVFPSISGITAGEDGQELIIINVDTNSFSRVDFIRTTSFASNKFYTNANTISLSRYDMIKFIYSEDLQAWVMQSLTDNEEFIIN